MVINDNNLYFIGKQTGISVAKWSKSSVIIQVNGTNRNR